MSKKASLNMLEEYKIDLYPALMGICNQRVLDSLGVDKYIYNDETGGYNLKDHAVMEADEYDSLIANPVKFLWETIVPRYCKKINGPDAVKNFKAFLGENNQFGAHVAGIYETASQQYGIPRYIDPIGPIGLGNPCENLFLYLRGIRGFSLDIKRIPDKVEAAIKALHDVFCGSTVDRVKNGSVGTSPDFCFDGAFGLLAHTVMSRAQFERFYWPSMKLFSDLCVEKDKIGVIIFEGDCKRFWDLLRELPENRFCIHSEMDDIFEMKKALPNVAVAGGMRLDLLGYGTTGECVAYAKKLIDELGSDGRYIFSEQKMLTFKNDCKHDNLKAVSDFVSSYLI
jgi:hypothetical protein